MLSPTSAPFCEWGFAGIYGYTTDLLMMARRTVGTGSDILRHIVSGWSHIQTQMRADVWGENLADHPDRAYCNYLTMGMEIGLIGFQYGRVACKSASSNMQSVLQHPEVVNTFVAAEVKTGKIFGPVGPELAPTVHVNRFGLVPKGHDTGQWRLT